MQKSTGSYGSPCAPLAFELNVNFVGDVKIFLEHGAKHEFDMSKGKTDVAQEELSSTRFGQKKSTWKQGRGPHTSWQFVRSDSHREN